MACKLDAADSCCAAPRAICDGPADGRLLWLAELGVKAEIWSGAASKNLELAGFAVGFAFTLAAAQGHMLRAYLPQALRWSGATGLGVLISLMAAMTAILTNALANGSRLF